MSARGRQILPGILSVRLGGIALAALALFLAPAVAIHARDRRNEPNCSGTVTQTRNPLVASYSVSCSRPARVFIEFGPDTSYGLKTWTRRTVESGGNHIVDILVAGMRAFTTYHMRAIAQFDERHTFEDEDRLFSTEGPTPARVPGISVTRYRAANVSGVELFGFVFSPPNEIQALATDTDGNLIWYYDFDSAEGFPFPIKLLSNGHLMLVVTRVPPPSVGLQEDSSIREIDLAGDIIRELTISDLNQRLKAHGFPLIAQSFHHDFCVLPNGHIVVLVDSEKTLSDLIGIPGDTIVQGDELVELDDQWQPTWLWSGFDHLDVNRHPMGTFDWTHANAVAYDKADGNLLLSLRSQSWILKIDYRNGHGSGDILWRLGPDGDFSMSGNSADWFYAQHAPAIFHGGDDQFMLGVFDNGNLRPMNGSPCILNCFSRALILRVQEDRHFAEREWQYLTNVFSAWGVYIERLNDDYIEVAMSQPDLTKVGSRIVQVTTDSEPLAVWQVDTDVLFYRAFRLPSLYPGVQW